MVLFDKTNMSFIDWKDSFDEIFQDLTGENSNRLDEIDAFDLEFFSSTNVSTIENEEKNVKLRPIDFPSSEKHYGLLSFHEFRFPIIYR